MEEKRLGRRDELLFSMLVPRSSASPIRSQTVVSAALPYPHRIRRLFIRYAPNVERLIYLRLFVSNENSAPADNSLPVGNPVFCGYGNQTYLQFASLVTMDLDIPVAGRNTYLKVHGYNADDFPHHVDVSVLIEEIEGDR